MSAANTKNNLISQLSNQDIISEFTKGLFWNFNTEKLDLLLHKNLIIERVIEAGLENDEVLMWKLYSYEDIKKVAIEIEYLSPEKLNYIAFVLKINEEGFKCYGQKPWYRKC
ncbi:MAG: hypothetical protein FWD22_01945 [Treponema sp.]|nr:hypothetical protein [Treponema sp.]